MRIKLLVILFFSLPIYAQNLVKNPSFEQTRNCAYKVGQFQSNVQYWSVPTKGTTDLYNSCSKGEIGIPANFSGYQEAKFEKNYAGCYFYSGKNYREYIQGEFSRSLEKGKKYTISMYLSLADYSNIAIDEIGVLFSSARINGSFEHELPYTNLLDTMDAHYMILKHKGFIEDKKNWTKMTAEYTAMGGEQYITIGNFKDNIESKTKKVILEPAPNDTSYYYLDEVSVIPLLDKVAGNVNATTIIKTEDPGHSIQKIDIGVIEFDHDSATLKSSAKTKLKELQLYLETHRSFSLKIIGHTDKTGSVQYNQSLSLKRATEVANYLVSMGISVQRIQSLGFGSRKPLARGNTLEGRQRNRRVEFEIIE